MATFYSENDPGYVRPQPRPCEVPRVSNDRPAVKGAGNVGLPDSSLPPVKNNKAPWK